MNKMIIKAQFCFTNGFKAVSEYIMFNGLCSGVSSNIIFLCLAECKSNTTKRVKIIILGLLRSYILSNVQAATTFAANQA